MGIKLNVGVIGGGNMGAAIISGIHKDNKVFVCEADLARQKYLKKKFNVSILALKDLLAQSNYIILATKPQDFETLLNEIKPYSKKNHVFVSIAAGITTQYIEKRLHPGARVIRTMPNLPAQVQQGVTAISAGRSASKTDLINVQKLFNTIGTTFIRDEKYIDSITAVSGSGPAYVYMFIECMNNAAVILGLDQKLSKEIVLQTIKGAVNLLEQQNEDAATLRKKVTSKGGTTQAALTVFEKADIQQIFNKALKSAKQRAKELSR
ncbi:MAG: pyrroline-5-carboxylate reductase [Candidatus Omnitrophica bacterium]|nr:pyrroline-5-carboxylate reductase [Candidatus Omnitrophota bacterium]